MLGHWRCLCRRLCVRWRCWCLLSARLWRIQQLPAVFLLYLIVLFLSSYLKFCKSWLGPGAFLLIIDKLHKTNEIFKYMCVNMRICKYSCWVFINYFALCWVVPTAHYLMVESIISYTFLYGAGREMTKRVVPPTSNKGSRECGEWGDHYSDRSRRLCIPLHTNKRRCLSYFLGSLGLK